MPQSKAPPAPGGAPAPRPGAESRLGAEALERYGREIFRRAGMTEAHAAAQAAALVWCNLHGIDSHGVLRVPWYVGLIEQGELNPTAEFRVARATPATVLIEADRGPGPAATLFAMAEVGRRAREAGACWGVIRNLSHQGALAYYTRQLAETGLIALATVSSPPNMAPFGARAAGLHNSPISIAVPAERRGALVLDMATSVAAGGKIYLAADRGLPIPPGWALDAAGESTTDPTRAKIWLPLGPKGSGLALMFECWSSLLAANALVLPSCRTVRSSRGAFVRTRSWPRSTSPRSPISPPTGARPTPSRMRSRRCRPPAMLQRCSRGIRRSRSRSSAGRGAFRCRPAPCNASGRPPPGSGSAPLCPDRPAGRARPHQRVFAGSCRFLGA